VVSLERSKGVLYGFNPRHLRDRGLSDPYGVFPHLGRQQFIIGVVLHNIKGVSLGRKPAPHEKKVVHVRAQRNNAFPQRQGSIETLLPVDRDAGYQTRDALV
jgi:hypothetical protein